MLRKHRIGKTKRRAEWTHRPGGESPTDCRVRQFDRRELCLITGQYNVRTHCVKCFFYSRETIFFLVNYQPMIATYASCNQDGLEYHTSSRHSLCFPPPRLGATPARAMARRSSPGRSTHDPFRRRKRGIRRIGPPRGIGSTTRSWSRTPTSTPTGTPTTWPTSAGSRRRRWPTGRPSSSPGRRRTSPGRGPTRDRLRTAGVPRRRPHPHRADLGGSDHRRQHRAVLRDPARHRRSTPGEGPDRPVRDRPPDGTPEADRRTDQVLLLGTTAPAAGAGRPLNPPPVTSPTSGPLEPRRSDRPRDLRPIGARSSPAPHPDECRIGRAPLIIRLISEPEPGGRRGRRGPGAALATRACPGARGRPPVRKRSPAGHD